MLMTIYKVDLMCEMALVWHLALENIKKAQATQKLILFALPLLYISPTFSSSSTIEFFVMPFYIIPFKFLALIVL